MKTLTSLLVYAFAFTLLLVTLYSLYLHESARPSEHDISGNKASVIWNVAGQRSLQAKAEAPRFQSRYRGPPIPIVQDCPHVPRPLMKYIPPVHSVPLSDREKLLAMCKQTEPIPLREFFTETMIRTLTKLGEGAFADVFGCQGDDWRKLALKILPVEGDFEYNDDPQLTFSGIQQETIISIELSLLGEESRRKNRSVPHYTKNFMQIDRVGLCKGKFPDFLMEAWDDYDFRKKSDNDRPDVFPGKQLYVVYAAEDAGMQLGSYVYHSFEEAVSILTQVAATVAVGEAALQFEHRDMHRGNVLVRRTHQETVYFRLDHKDYYIKTHGVLATIVDYTLSRIKQGDCSSYSDLSKRPWLFRGKGDIQFDVYRNMRNASGSHWDTFTPYTNVLWINYLSTKVSIKGKLKHISARSWKQKFKPYLRDLLKYHSARELFMHVFAPNTHRGPS